ncbi:uncharacterized protein LOC133913377 [Phragmites australis]|uniref:uncharacterized protein LOC133913377 n=1 Tax=Phragmites australis TaxID=29695 RepID=UPI002D79E9D6|nr:uncharacterized protein LOC133913377 [Phragmites australis]XP_062212494.1 uncharacterized protein LOC133913377 [Phragmites australis]XP_062212495.1 uncharacterized protein LOC133913377 [Phragmites australis]XP_062212496.1 uncharacterized protein LOC133913377 [Phragmites australis]
MDAGAEEVGRKLSDAVPQAQNLDPGPVDKSVLVEQELHKSEAIFVGKIYKPVRFIEHGTRLNQWEVTHEGMLAILQRSGFYHLSFLKRVQLDHALLNALVERWRRETQTFHLRFGEMTVLLKDVAILTGLRVHGAPVTGPTDCNWERLCIQLLGQEPPQIKGGSINIAWLHDTFKNLPEGANQSDIEYATRAYILYQIGCSLFPDPSGTRVHLRYLALLRNFDASGEMAWGAAVLAHLYRELGKASMKGKANCCAFLTLLQIWAWEHIQICCPERLENKALTNDQPLGCRWNVPFKNRENVRSMDHEFYRHGLDTISDCQITWDPYTPNLIAGLPAICTFGYAVWRSRTPLICFQIVEMHVPDRVLLQFGMSQHIPDPVEAVERVTMQGKADQDWSAYHDKYIKLWENRLSSVVKQRDTGNLDPTHARNCYLEWYWRITRRWISTPVECPVISYQLSGHTEKVLVDLISTVQGRIRTLLLSEIDAKRMKESLIDIDVYITVKMEEAKQVMRSDVPTGMGIGSVKSAMICSNIVDPTQATVAKMEQVSDDHVEGYTILQLDQMRRIQSTGGTPDLAPLTTGDSTNNQIEDVHPQEDPLDVIMTEVNLRDIISTPVEDAMTEIMNTSTEDATLGNISDSGEKNGYASIETVEEQETVGPIDNSKVYEKIMPESQESADAPLTNGQGTVRKPSLVPQFYKILGVSTHNAQLQITGASENAGTIEDIVGTRMENSTVQGTMGQPFNAIGRGDTLHASMNKLSSMRDDVEPPSGSEQEEHAAAMPGRNELQHAVQTQPEDNVVQDRVDAMQNPIFRGNVEDPIENSISNHSVVREPVAIPTEDLLILSVGEKIQRSANSFTGEATHTIVWEESAGDEDHGNPGPNEISERGKLIIPSHENSEVRLTIEASKMDGNAKTEEKTCQNVRSGSGQLIAFTRRKRKHLCSHRLDS